MGAFRYMALDSSGRRVGGVLTGSSEQAVLSELEARRLTPVSIEEKTERRRGLRRRVSRRRLAMTYTQLSDLLRAGVPLLRGLRLLASRRSQPQISAVFREVADAVADGSDLADAMERRGDVFPTVHVAMVRAGEKGGFLDEVLNRLGKLVLGQADLRSRVIGSTVYPAILVTVGAVILAVIFSVFVPKMRPLFEQMPTLPLATRVVFGVSAALTTYGPISLLVVVFGAVVFWRVSRRPTVRVRLAEVRTRLPVIGPLTRALAVGRFARMLGTMLTNSIPMLSALSIARQAAGNVLLERAIERATEAVRAGQPLAPPLAESGLVDEDVVEMIAVAESANNLDEVLTTIADTIEGRIDRILSTAIRLLEPLLLLVIAGAVVLVAFALILPMTQMRAGL